MENARGLDQKILFQIQKKRTKFMDYVMHFITNLGTGGLVWVLLIFYFTIRGNYSSVIILGAAVGGCALINNIVIKACFRRERPCDLFLQVPLLVKRPMGSSFPSGHTATSFASAIALFYINPAVGILASALAFLIGFSRVYLFVHFPSDVLFGMISGILISLIIVPPVIRLWSL